MDGLNRYLQGLSRLAGIALGAAYLVLGAIILFARADFLQFDNVLRYVFGGLVIIYGLYRITRAYKSPPVR